MACLFRVPHFVITASESTVRKLCARSAERQVHGGSCMPISEKTTSTRLGENEGKKEKGRMVR
jgi:hypothetical protein